MYSRLLLTGYTGFIGAHLLQILRRKSYHITLLGRKDIYGTTHIPYHFNNERSPSLPDGIDCVIHLAAKAHDYDKSKKEFASKVYAINVDATLKLANEAMNKGIKRFIFLSSVGVFGHSSEACFATESVTNPHDTYTYAKLEAEIGLLEFSKRSGMEVVIIRAPLVYGKGCKGRFPCLMGAIAKGFPLPLQGITQNKRSLVSVYNLVDLIINCIDNPAAANQTFLVSDDRDLSTAEIVALMAKVMRKRNLALPVPPGLFKLAGKLLHKEDVVNRLIGSLQVDIEHTKKTLNWKPPYSVDHGFRLAAEWILNEGTH